MALTPIEKVMLMKVLSTSGQGIPDDINEKIIIKFYNDSGVPIAKGKVLHPIGGHSDGINIVPTVELAISSEYEKCQGTLFVSSEEVADGAFGYAIRFGAITGVDTSLLGAGAQIWLSDTSAGDFVNSQPEFPSYVISMGGTLNADANGSIFISQTTNVGETIFNAFDGSIRETFDFRITSDGVTITGELTNPTASNKLTCIFSDGFYQMSCGVGDCTLELTGGSATIPQINYVYIDKADKTLKTSIVDFPETEHCKVALVSLLDAAETQSNGALRNQNINDHIKSDLDNGHVLHIAERIRQLNAQWENGVEASLNGTPTNGYLSTTTGKVWQMHKHTFEATNMATGDDAHVINDPTTPYNTISNLNVINSYSTGSAWNNEWGNIVVWGVANKSGEESHIMINLPSGGETTEDKAIEDVSKYTNYNIPDAFKGVGFLIASFTIKIQGGTITYNPSTGYTDLRGFMPNNTAGAGVGGGITSFLGLEDTPSSYSGNAGKTPIISDSEDGLEFKDVPQTDITGITGADKITNIISLTQAEYDAIGTPDASTLYVITD